MAQASSIADISRLPAHPESGSTAAKSSLPHQDLVLIEALRSLYVDGLEPFEYLVLRRLQEHTNRRWSSNELRRLARMTPGVVMLDAEAKLPSTGVRCRFYLAQELQGFQGFVDLSLLHDPYPPDLWEDLQSGIADLIPCWDQTIGDRAGSRYDLASSLREHIPVLQEYRLGDICHMVQLGVHMQLFGYKRGRIVPFADSVDRAKLSRAELRQPSGLQNSDGYIRDWSELRDLLREMLSEPRWLEGVPLSALKGQCRHRFAKELSETALGHTKLSTLVEDPRLSDFFSVCQRGAERFLLPDTNRSAVVHECASSQQGTVDCKHSALINSCSVEVSNISDELVSRNAIDAAQATPDAADVFSAGGARKSASRAKQLPPRPPGVFQVPQMPLGIFQAYGLTPCDSQEECTTFPRHKQAPLTGSVACAPELGRRHRTRRGGRRAASGHENDKKASAFMVSG